MTELRQRLIDLGITGVVERQQILQEVYWWIEEHRKMKPTSNSKDHAFERGRVSMINDLLISLNSKKPIEK